MSAAAPAPATPSASTRTSWLLRGLLAAAGVIIFSFVFGLALLTLGNVHGEEFSPDTFERRTFHYWEIPLVGVQISGVTRNDRTGRLEEFLVAQDLIPTIENENQTWHLVSVQRGASATRHADAAILCTYLDSRDYELERVWLQWSKEHPELAELFWPAVVELARHELYIFLPDLFKLARSTQDPNELKEGIDQLLAQQYQQLAIRQQQAGQHELAVEILDAALQHRPDDDQLKSLRAQSLQELEMMH